MLNEQGTIQILDGAGNIVDISAQELPLLPVVTPPIGFPPPVTLPVPPTFGFALLTGSAGSTGKDYSVNAPEAPLIGSITFGGEGVYKDWVCLQTVPANTGASERLVCNNSDAGVLVVLDDGTAVGGSTPTDSSVFLLNPPSTSSPNDASWRSERFKGRVRVFAPSQFAWVTITEA